MYPVYLLLLAVVCVGILLLPHKPNPKRQGIGFLVIGVVFLFEAVRFHMQSRHGVWLWAAGAALEFFVGVYVLNKSRKKQ